MTTAEAGCGFAEAEGIGEADFGVLAEPMVGAEQGTEAAVLASVTVSVGSLTVASETPGLTTRNTSRSSP